MGQASVLLDSPQMEVQVHVSFPASAGDQLEVCIESVDEPNSAVTFRASKLVQQWTPPGTSDQQVAAYA